MALRTITLAIDELDYRAIQYAIAQRQLFNCMPDSGHDDANLAGRVIAEICRGWAELLDLWPPDGFNEPESEAH